MRTMHRWAIVLLLAAACLCAARPVEAVSERVLADWIYSRALGFPKSATIEGEPESDEAREVRLRVLSVALAVAVLPEANGSGYTAYGLAAAILNLWNEETRLDHRIHAGLPHPVWTSDLGRAKCLGQIHTSSIVPPEEWARLAGTGEEASLQCARATVRVWVAQAKHCGLWRSREALYVVAATYMAYGSGGHCKPDDRAWDRAKKWQKLMTKAPKDEPIPGFRRIVPGEIPTAVQDEATRVADALRAGVRKRGEVVKMEHEGKHYALLVEGHAKGRVGVSVLRQD